MTVLREIAARFDISVDTAPLGRLDSAVNRSKAVLGSLAFSATAALASLGAALLPAIEAASKAEEVANKIEAIFGKSQRAEIEAWSKTVEAEMGRSEFAFQSSFSDFAAFLDPMKIGLDRTVLFSKQLAKLTVDLASFYNTSEEETRRLLFSGLAGEAEAVRRLGIDISESALANTFHSNKNPLGAAGFAGGKQVAGKGLDSLSQPDKVQLRMAKIMEDTAKAQGDAARTADGWANSVKRLSDRFNKLQVAIGSIAKVVGAPLVNSLGGVVKALEATISKTSVMQTAVGALGAAAVLWTGRWAVANAALAASFLPILVVAAKLAAPLLVIEDFVTFFRNDENKSALGIWVRSLEDIARPAQTLRNAIADLPRAWRRWVDELRNSDSIVTRSITRTVDWWFSGKDVADNSMEMTQSESIRADAEARRKARAEAVAKGDVKTFTENRRLDQTEGEMLPSFLLDRAKYVESHPAAATESDIGSGLISREKVDAAKKMQAEAALRNSSATSSGSPAGSGGTQVTIAPKVEMKVSVGLDAGRYQLNDLKLAVQGVLDDAAEKARHNLRRVKVPKL